MLEVRLPLTVGFLGSSFNAQGFEVPSNLPPGVVQGELPEFLRDPKHLAEINAGPIRWGGEDRFAYNGQWIIHVENPQLNTSLLAQQIEMNQLRAGRAPAGIQVVENLFAPGIYLIEADAGTTQQHVMQSLAGIPGFKYAEPNFVVWSTATFPDDPSFPSQWGLHNTGQSGGTPGADISAPAAWDVTTGSGNVVIAVIDTGVDYTHPDLVSNMWVNPGEIPGDGIDNDGNGFIDDIYGVDFINNDSDPMDDRGHGTHVAGTIAAAGNNGVGVTGVSWNAQIMSLKFLGANGRGSTSNAVKAVNYATMMKRDYGVNVVATNNSWGGGGFSSMLVSAIEAAAEENILFVAAAGNDNANTDQLPHYPSSYDSPSIISVAATTRHDQKSSFSNFGATTVDLGAPGSTILSTTPGNTYSNYNGTSMATPHVAGVVALLFDAFPEATWQEVRDAILASVDPIPALDGITVTGGRLNAYAALQEMGMRVASSTPGVGEVVFSQPSDYTFTFSNPFNPATVQPSDLTVNSIPADSFTLVSPDTITFHYNVTPVAGEGLQQMSIAAGAISRTSDGEPLRAFNGTFRYDALAMEVVTTTPGDGSLVVLPLTTIEVTVNEPIDPASISIADLTLSQGTAQSFSLVDVDRIAFAVSGITNDEVLQLEMAAGALTDVHGNPMLAFNGTLVLDVLQTQAHPFERLEPLGGLIFASRNNPGLIHADGDVDEFLISIEGGQTVAAVVTPDDPGVTMTIELLGFAGPSVAAGPGQAVGIGPITIADDRTLRVRVGGDAATTYRVDIYRNAAIEVGDSSPGSPLAIDNSLVPLGEGRYGVVGSKENPASPDAYTVNLSDAVGQSIDVVLAGIDGADFAAAQLQLIGPDGSTVVATAQPDPLGDLAHNFDLAILDYVVPAPGTYRVQLTSAEHGDYALIVTRGLRFENETNDLTGDPLRSLDGVRRAVGIVDNLPFEGLVEFILDANLTEITIGGVLDLGLLGTVPIQEQSPGSLTTNFEGFIRAAVQATSIQFLGDSTIDAIEQPGPFLPGNVPGDVAGHIPGDGTAIAAVLTDLIFDGVSFPIPLVNGTFAADQFTIETTSGNASVEVPGVLTDVYDIAGLLADNESATPATLEVHGEQLQMTVPIEVSLLVAIPDFYIPASVLFEITGTVFASARIPTPQDLYTITLGADEAIDVTAARLLPGSGSLNTAALKVIVRDEFGTPLLEADSGNGDAASLTFVAPAAGTYQVVVEATSGMGEYLLAVDPSPPVVDSINGPAVAKTGVSQSFTFAATHPSATQQAAGFTYEIDWNGDGVVDETLPGGATLMVDHAFDQPQSAAVTVTVVDSLGARSAASSHTVHVYRLEFVAGDVIWEGTDGHDRVQFIETAPETVEVHTLQLGGIELNLIEAFENVNGSVIAEGHRGNDRLDASALQTIGAQLTGGRGHDTLLGGAADDLLRGDSDGAAGDGAEGNDLIDGGSGNDTIYGDVADGGEGGSDTILAGPGNDLIFGDGGDGAEGRRDSIVGGDGDDTIYGHTGSDWIDGGLGNDILVGGPDGSEGNDTLIGGGGDDILVGGNGSDSLVGSAGSNLLIGGDGDDALRGGNSGDLLLAGATLFDDDLLALSALRAEWTSGAAYETRADRVRGILNDGQNAPYFLVPGSTVLEDDDTDTLQSGAGSDLFFYHFAEDLVLDLIAGEITVDTDPNA